MIDSHHPNDVPDGFVELTTADASRLAADALAAVPWPAPTPLDAPPAVPPFPVDALSPWLRAFVDAASDVFQVPPDMPGLLVLPFVGAALAHRCVFSPWGGWREPPVLYALAVALSGENKSAVLGALRRPVEEVQRLKRRDATDAIREATSTRATLEIRVKHLREAVAKGRADRAALLDAERELAEARVPELPCLMFGGDATPEALTILLAKHDERQLVAAAEGGAVESLTGLRYQQKGSAAVNVDLVLQAHGGEPVTVHRVGRESVSLASPLLSLALAVQPIILENAAEHPDLLHRGVIPRMLIAWPESMVGRRNMGARVWPEGVRDGYEDRMRALWSRAIDRDPDGSPAPTCVPFSREALDLFVAWLRDLESRRGPGGALADPPVMAAWSNKLEGACVRVAGILHAADRADFDGCDLGGEIDVETLRRAIRLCEYFEAHAVRAFAAVTRHDPAEEDARAILASLRRTPPPDATVSTRDVQRRRSECTAERALAALDLLTDHGFVRPLPPPVRAGAGRPPAPRYELHPSIAPSKRPSPDGGSVDMVNVSGRSHDGVLPKGTGSVDMVNDSGRSHGGVQPKGAGSVDMVNGFGAYEPRERFHLDRRAAE